MSPVVGRKMQRQRFVFCRDVGGSNDVGGNDHVGGNDDGGSDDVGGSVVWGIDAVWQIYRRFCFFFFRVATAT